MSRCVFLLNRAAGGAERGLDANQVCETVENAFRAAGHEITSILAPPEALDRELTDIIQAKPGIVLIGGGDGTVSTAAGRLGGTQIAMGIIPMGTFNLAARDLGVPLEINAAATFLASAEIVRIDVLDISGHACLCTMVIGFYPEFADFFERRDHGGYWWKKAFKLLLGLRHSFMIARSLRLIWESDGGNGKARTKFSAFVPGRYKDTAGLIPERTDFSSGSLTAYIGTHRTPSSALRGVLDYVLGNQEQNPEVVIVKARRMTLRAQRRKTCKVMLDGEVLRLRFPIELAILPAHLQVLTTPEEPLEVPPRP